MRDLKVEFLNQTCKIFAKFITFINIYKNFKKLALIDKYIIY